MINLEQAQAVLSFLEQYHAFLCEMANNEKEKLASLVSNDLERIEHSILTAQSDAKKLESLEKKRTRVQVENNCEGFTLTQICEATPEDIRARMLKASQDVRASIADVKWNNDKAMGVARMNIMQVNPDAVLTTVKQDHSSSNPYQRAQNREHDAESVQLLTTKV